MGIFSAEISEFTEAIQYFLTQELVHSLQGACEKMYLSMFSQANEATENAAAQLMVAPENMFPGVYTILVNIAETVFFPLAGLILACILCYEAITMMTESNRMRDFGPQDVFILCLKMLGGIVLLTHSMNLVNLGFKIGQWAVQKAGIESGNGGLDIGFDAAAYINQCEEIFPLLGYLVLGSLVKALIVLFSVVIKVAVWLRFVELYMFAVSSPIPFSTFLNKEWSQIGYNYVRKIASLAFQPVYMILCFSIFTGTLILQPDSGLFGPLLQSLAAMFVLGLALFKTGTIADSIFNAH